MREGLARTRASLSGLRDLRWVLEGQLHVTLRFFADLPSERVSSVAAAAAAACTGRPAFDLAVRGLGRYPSHGPLRVLWAGLGEGREELGALAEALAKELEARGFPREERPFAAHLTLARSRGPAGSREAARAVAAETPAAGAFGPQRVDALGLYRSELGSGPPVHTPIGRFVLG